jgi:hypothetical protein
MRDTWTEGDPLETLLTDKGASLATHVRVPMRRDDLLEHLLCLLDTSGYLCWEHADESPDDCKSCEAEALMQYLKEPKPAEQGRMA